MKVLIWTNVFPTFSETFIRNHILGLIDRDLKVFIHSDKKDSEYLNALNGYERYNLLNKVVTIDDYLPKNIVLRVFKAFVILFISLFKGNTNYYLRTLNFKAFKKKAATLRYFYLLHFMVKNNIEVVHAHYGTNGKKLVFLKQIKYPISLITTFHGYDLRIKKEYAKELYKPLFEFSDKVISISNFNERILLSLGLNKQKIFKLNNGVNVPNKPSSFIGNKDRIIQVLSVGRLVSEKGYHIAIDALCKIKNVHPNINFHYHIVGDGVLRDELILYVKKMQLENEITFHLYQSSSFVKRMLRKSHFLLLTSINESLPVVILEAQSYGLPVLASDVGSIQDVVDSKTGVLVKPNTESVYNGLIKLIHNRFNWFNLGEEARAKILSDYDEEKQMDKLVVLYHETLKALEY